jgi:vancomycin resistance protein YoaR
VSARRIAVLVVAAAPLVVAGLTTLAWLWDRPDDQGRVARGVALAGNELSGASRAEVTENVEAIATEFGNQRIQIGGAGISEAVTASQLGYGVDVDRTVDAVMRTGHHDRGPLGPLRWAKALIVERPVALQMRLEPNVARKVLMELEGSRRTEPTEPNLAATVEGVRLIPGSPGTAVDLAAALGSLPRAVVDPRAPLRINLRQVVTRPKVSDDAVAALAARATANTEGEITVRIDDTTHTIDGKMLRPGFGVSVMGDRPALTLDPTHVGQVLNAAIQPKPNPTGVRFTLVDGKMVPVPGSDATVCCSSEAPALLVAAVLEGRSEVTLPSRTLTAAEGVEWAASLGVNEVVGEFTTRHPAGQPRVRNIHRMADELRGWLIAPGETFSVNGAVGRRTAEKGYVNAPVIDEGQFKNDIGGGVSQFATTLFNAAFFAGLDIPQHKAHSIYISRYPFGREATLAYPSVDLKIRNNTPYGVVIWPTYTPSSITVQLWSTRYAVGAQTGQNKKSGCGAVTVTRTRTFVDGRTDQQTYRANYTCNPPAS